MNIRTAIAELIARRDLSDTDMEAVVAEIMSGAATAAQIGAFMVALRMKGERVSELVGAARALRRFGVSVETTLPVVDTCGTGGDLQGTFNISTAAALIATGAGVSVAKHGNRAMSGAVGGADVLEALGVRIDLDAAQAAACLAEVGMVFLFAQRFHPAMRYAAAPRREIGVRTIFNLLGPLANPAGARAQVLGVFAPEWVEPMAQTLAGLGSRRALVVHGDDGLDEISLTGPTRIAELRDGFVRCYQLTPHDLGLDPCTAAALRGGDVQLNAAIVRRVLRGEATRPQMDVALLNAAAVIYVAGRADDIRMGLTLARESVDTGRARQKLEALVEAGHRLGGSRSDAEPGAPRVES
jgi:anthranilate phosphoribosyltransferase